MKVIRNCPKRPSHEQTFLTRIERRRSILPILDIDMQECHAGTRISANVSGSSSKDRERVTGWDLKGGIVKKENVGIEERDGCICQGNR